MKEALQSLVEFLDNGATHNIAGMMAD